MGNLTKVHTRHHVLLNPMSISHQTSSLSDILPFTVKKNVILILIVLRNVTNSCRESEFGTTLVLAEDSTKSIMYRQDDV